MKELMHQARVLLARLNPREQRLVAVFGVLLAAVLGWNAVLGPFLGGRETLAHQIDGLKAELASLESLARQIRERQATAAQGASAAAPGADFSLLGFVEKAAGEALRAESIASMTPARRPLEAGRVESTVEVKLTAVSYGEAVAFLQALEEGASPVFVKQFALKKRYDDASHFDLGLVAAVNLPG